MKKYLTAAIITFVAIIVFFTVQQFLLPLLPQETLWRSALMQVSPIIRVSQDDKPKKNLSERLLGFDISQPISILMHESAFFQYANATMAEQDEPVTTPQPTAAPQNTPEPERKPIEEVTIASSDDILVKNNTTYEINKTELLNALLPFELGKEGPHVLICHSHSSESYTPTDQNYYVPTDPSRTEDTRFNVVRVGQEFAKKLADMGISVIHDQEIHDYPSYNGSYTATLKSTQAYLAKYPSIKIVVDIHRDAIVRADGTKLKVCADINDEKAAQVMILTGTDQGGLQHDGWRNNLSFAMKWQKYINETAPGLTRPIQLTKERYNTHTTPAAVILEVGSNGNTLEEALVGSRYAAEALGNLLKKLK